MEKIDIWYDTLTELGKFAFVVFAGMAPIVLILFFAGLRKWLFTNDPDPFRLGQKKRPTR